MEHSRIAEAEQMLNAKQAEEALAVLVELDDGNCCSGGDRARIQWLIGAAQEQLVQFNQAFAAYDRARGLYSELDDERAATLCNARCAINLIRMKQVREGVYRCNAALPLAGVNGWRDIAAVTRHALALADYYQGNKESAAREMVKAATEYRELGMADEEENVSSNLAMIYLELGRDDLAQPYLAREIHAGDRPEDVRALAKKYLNNAVAAWYKGDSESAKGLLAKAQRIGHERQNHRILANAQTNLGLIYADEGEYRMAHKMLVQGWQSAVKCSDEHVGGVALSSLANTMVFLNDPSQAREYMNLCMENCTAPDAEGKITREYYRAIIELANDNAPFARQIWEAKSPLPVEEDAAANIEAMSKLFEHIGTVEFREATGLSDEALDLAAQWCSELGELEVRKPEEE